MTEWHGGYEFFNSAAALGCEILRQGRLRGGLYDARLSDFFL
jgi:hypothetical protein